jgi:hypothetical protein
MLKSKYGAPKKIIMSSWVKTLAGSTTEFKTKTFQPETRWRTVTLGGSTAVADPRISNGGGGFIKVSSVSLAGRVEAVYTRNLSISLG